MIHNNTYHVIHCRVTIKVVTARNQGSAWTIRYYRLINRKRIGEAVFSETENVISIITDHIKYIEAQQLSNMESASDRSPTWSKPANINLWVIDKP